MMSKGKTISNTKSEQISRNEASSDLIDYSVDRISKNNEVFKANEKFHKDKFKKALESYNK